MPGIRLLSKLYCLSGKDIKAHRTKLSLVNSETTHRRSFTCQINIRRDSAPGHMAGNQEQYLEKELFVSEYVNAR